MSDTLVSVLLWGLGCLAAVLLFCLVIIGWRVVRLRTKIDKLAALLVAQGYRPDDAQGMAIVHLHRVMERAQQRKAQARAVAARRTPPEPEDEKTALQQW